MKPDPLPGMTFTYRYGFGNVADKSPVAVSSISLWEIAMLVAKGRLDPGTDALSFLKLVLASRVIRPLPITPEIAEISANDALFAHHDPADRIIVASPPVGEMTQSAFFSPRS